MVELFPIQLFSIEHLVKAFEFSKWSGPLIQICCNKRFVQQIHLTWIFSSLSFLATDLTSLDMYEYIWFSIWNPCLARWRNAQLRTLEGSVTTRLCIESMQSCSEHFLRFCSFSVDDNVRSLCNDWCKNVCLTKWLHFSKRFQKPVRKTRNPWVNVIIQLRKDHKREIFCADRFTWKQWRHRRSQGDKVAMVLFDWNQTFGRRKIFGWLRHWVEICSYVWTCCFSKVSLSGALSYFFIRLSAALLRNDAIFFINFAFVFFSRVWREQGFDDWAKYHSCLPPARFVKLCARRPPKHWKDKGASNAMGQWKESEFHKGTIDGQYSFRNKFINCRYLQKTQNKSHRCVRTNINFALKKTLLINNGTIITKSFCGIKHMNKQISCTKIDECWSTPWSIIITQSLYRAHYVFWM